MQPNTTPKPVQTRTKREPGTRTRREPAEQQRGIRLFHRPDRPSPYGVQWRVDGKTRTEFFLTETARDTRAGAIRAEKKKGVPAASRSDAVFAASFRAAVGGTPWTEVVEGWRQWVRHVGSPQTRTTATVGSLTKAYLAELKVRRDREEIAAATYRRNKPKIEKFGQDFGDLPVASVTAKAVEEWLRGLGHGPDSFNTHRGILLGLFAGVSPNPVSPVRKAQKIADEVGVLSAEDTGKLFSTAAKYHPAILPRLAMEAFCGVRFASACRMSRDDVKPRHGVLLPAYKIKTKRRFYLEGLPENLWAWFERYDCPATWEMGESSYMAKKSACFTLAAIPHPHNCLRHSFCTYHVSAYGDPGKTSLILCHRNQQLLWSTYRGRATQAEGLAYFSLLPDTPPRPQSPPETS